MTSTIASDVRAESCTESRTENHTDNLPQADTLIIGGSFAGLSAALQLARAQRRVVIVDAGEPRNRFAHEAHGFFTLDGVAPHEVNARALEPVLRYPTVSHHKGRVIEAGRDDDGFVIRTENGDVLRGKSLILATGVRDELPWIPGLPERWGHTVVHCPYCHGYELRGLPIAVLAGSGHSAVQAAMLPDWGPVTYFTQGEFEPDDEQKALLDKRGVAIERTPIVAIEGPETGGDSLSIAAVRLADGRAMAAGAVYIAPKTRIAEGLVAQLGLETESMPTGDIIRTDALGQTSVAGVFAAGDNASGMHNATLASAAGVMAGVAAHRYLMFGAG
ncbi:NAD(P)/FAD-dependent oxidoreductase [Thalassolituus sp. LLYu03]|uniref:NAD(P)/FAD-dependent oxidoreductase n=1 Tax=Thalassolituus sp. LLYu03 TaxID=3421656 RepID=UPI003D294C70